MLIKRGWNKVRLPGLVNQYQRYLVNRIQSQLLDETPISPLSTIPSNIVNQPKVAIPSLLGYYQQYLVAPVTTAKPVALPDPFASYCIARFGRGQFLQPMVGNIALLCKKHMMNQM